MQNVDIKEIVVAALAAWSALYWLARLIVALTPTPKDDAAIEKYIGGPLKALAKLFGLDLKQGRSTQ